MAQEDHKIEITGDYSYFRFNPRLSKYFNSHSLNGGGGDVTYFLTSMIGLKADRQGYGSYTQCTKPGAPIQGCASGNLFTYMFGPELKFRMGKLEPFGEVLVGGAHSNLYANACTKITGLCVSKSPSNNAFAFDVGGGVDFAATEKVIIRIVDTSASRPVSSSDSNGDHFSPPRDPSRVTSPRSPPLLGLILS